MRSIPRAATNRQRLLDRFLRYVQIDTTANEHAARYPSSDGQFELGRMLVEELMQMGAADIVHDEHGLVFATVPSSSSSAAPTVALNAHLDTSPETCGADVRPHVIANYSGGDIRLSAAADAVIRVAENPELEQLVGCTLITSDGTTLLGADDKAGLAIIMEVAQSLLDARGQPDARTHGDVRLLFTCDEEIGRGVDHVDLGRLAATVCYTLDGPAAGHIDVETFSADLAVVRFTGVNIHPAIAQGRMVNAVKLAAAFVDRLPSACAPELTTGREGFLHPYAISGGVASAELRVLLRDFETARLTSYAAQLNSIARTLEVAYPSSRIEVDVRSQYRNLGEGLSRDPRAVAFAEQAHARLRLPSTRSIIRGGTDGSQLTALGLPTPNLSAGQHNPHSRLEWACLEEMEQAVAVTLETIAIWGE